MMGTYAVKVQNAEYEVDAPDEATAWKWANASHQPKSLVDQIPGGENAPPPTPEPTGNVAQKIYAAVKTAKNMGMGVVASLPALAQAVITPPRQGENKQDVIRRQFAKYSPAITDPLEAKYTQATGQFLNDVGMGALPGLTGEINALAASIKPALSTMKANSAMQRAGGELAQQAKVDQSRLAAPVIDAATKAKQYDISLLPNEVKSTVGGRTMTAIADPEKLAGQAARTNQPKVDLAIREQLGIDGPLTPNAFNKARADSAAPYKAISKLPEVVLGDEYQAAVASANKFKNFQEVLSQALGGKKTAKLVEQFASLKTMTGDEAIMAIRDLRKSANAVDDALAAGVNPPSIGKQNAATAAKQISKAIEDSIGTTLQELDAANPGQGYGTLAKDLAEMRTRIAQLHTVERFTNPAGHVDAAKLGKWVFEKGKGSTVTGPIRDMAEIGAMFPEVVSTPQGASPNLSGARVFSNLAGFGGAGTIGWLAGGAPGAIIAGSMWPVIRSAARHRILSKGYQGKYVNPTDFRHPLEQQGLNVPPAIRRPDPNVMVGPPQQGFPKLNDSFDGPLLPETNPLAPAPQQRVPLGGIPQEPISIPGTPGANLQLGQGGRLSSPLPALQKETPLLSLADEMPLPKKTPIYEAYDYPLLRGAKLVSNKELTPKVLMEKMQDRQWASDMAQKARDKAAGFAAIAKRAESEAKVKSAMENRKDLIFFAEYLEEGISAGRPTIPKGKSQGVKTRGALEQRLRGALSDD